MRKVLYWDNKMSDQKAGIFHCWAGTMQDAYALIEDTNTGTIHRMNDNQFRFVQPPETKTHSKDAAKVEIVNAELLGKKCLDLLLPVLEAINKKLDTI